MGTTEWVLTLCISSVAQPCSEEVQEYFNSRDECEYVKIIIEDTFPRINGECEIVVTEEV